MEKTPKLHEANEIKPASSVTRTPPAAVAPVAPITPQPEKVRYVEIERKKANDGPGCGWLMNCRCWCCGCFLFVAAFIIALAYIIIAKPPFVVNPIKNFLNDGLQPIVVSNLNADAVAQNLQAQIQGFTVGENTLVIKQDELKVLLDSQLKDKAAVIHDLNVDIEDNKIKAYWNTDPDAEVPLWAVVELQDQNGSLVISKIGTERIGLPAFVNDIVTKVILSALNIDTSGGQKVGIANVAFPVSDQITIDGIIIQKDQLIVTLNLKSGLENLFPSDFSSGT